MPSVTVPVVHGGRTFMVDLELFLIVAEERMQRAQIGPIGFLGSVSTVRLAFFDYLRETDVALDGIDLHALLDAGAAALRNNPRCRRAILAFRVDDSGWSGVHCPELRQRAIGDFVAWFPTLHNLVHAGLLNREIHVWCLDRLYLAGINGASFHRLTFAEQRRRIAGVEDLIFADEPGADMSGFYADKIAEALEKITSEGHRSLLD